MDPVPVIEGLIHLWQQWGSNTTRLVSKPRYGVLSIHKPSVRSSLPVVSSTVPRPQGAVIPTAVDMLHRARFSQNLHIYLAPYLQRQTEKEGCSILSRCLWYCCRARIIGLFCCEYSRRDVV